MEDAKTQAIFVKHLLDQPAYGSLLGPYLAVVFLTEPERMAIVIEQGVICNFLAGIACLPLKLTGFINNPMPGD